MRGGEQGEDVGKDKERGNGREGVRVPEKGERRGGERRKERRGGKKSKNTPSVKYAPGRPSIFSRINAVHTWLKSHHVINAHTKINSVFVLLCLKDGMMVYV